MLRRDFYMVSSGVDVPESSPFPVSEIIAGVAVVMAFGKNALDWIRTWGSAEAKRASRDAVDQRDIVRHDAALAALQAEQKAATDRFTKHDKDCAEFRGEMRATIRSIEETGNHTARSVEQLQSQLRLAITGGGDRALEIRPSVDKDRR